MVNFYGNKISKLRKWLHPEDYQRAVEENYQQVKAENKEERKKSAERRKKISEFYGEEQEGGFLRRYNPIYLLNNAIFKDTYFDNQSKEGQNKLNEKL